MIFSDTKITLIGSGWLGLPLANHLKNIGYDVAVTTTTEEKKYQLETSGMETFLFKSQISASFQERLMSSSVVIFTIPPGKDIGATKDNLKLIIDNIPPRTKVLYTSSTGVYRHLSASHQLIHIDENADVAGPLVPLEQIISASPNPFLIFRLGGLCGPERHPGRFLAGKKNVEDGNTVVNLVHLKDVIQWMTALLELEIENDIFQLTADIHPQRQTFYPFAAQQIGREVPEFETCDSSPAGICVSNKKIKETTGLACIFPDPFLFEY